MLALESITASYGSSLVLEGVSLTLRPGTLTAIIGPNGGGKSTLLRVAAALMRPRSGRVTLDDKDVFEFAPPQRAVRMAFVSQRPVAPPDFSVREVVRLGRFASGRSLRDNLVDEAIGAMDLAGQAEQPLGTLSVGQQQRVAVARALAQLGLPGREAAPPGVLLADEPVSAMDPAHALATIGRLRAIARAGHVVGVVMHDLSLAANAADRIAVLACGRLLATGSVPEVVESSCLETAFGTPFRRVKDGSKIVGVVATGPATLPVP